MTLAELRALREATVDTKPPVVMFVTAKTKAQILDKWVGDQPVTAEGSRERDEAMADYAALDAALRVTALVQDGVILKADLPVMFCGFSPTYGPSPMREFYRGRCHMMPLDEEFDR